MQPDTKKMPGRIKWQRCLCEASIFQCEIALFVPVSGKWAQRHHSWFPRLPARPVAMPTHALLIGTAGSIDRQCSTQGPLQGPDYYLPTSLIDSDSSYFFLNSSSVQISEKFVENHHKRQLNHSPARFCTILHKKKHILSIAKL